MVDDKGDWLDRLIQPFRVKEPKVRKEPDLAFAAMTALEIDIEKRMAEHGYKQAMVNVRKGFTTIHFTGKGKQPSIKVTLEVTDEDS